MTFTGGREPINWTDDPEEGFAGKRIEDYSQGAFVIQCYHLDYNGTQYGPKDKFFMIRRYEGEKDINTLPCFPLVCDRDRTKLRNKLLHLGGEFAKLSTANNVTYRHKTYAGLTVDQQQEQVCRSSAFRALLTEPGRLTSHS
jgi:hypothetical protein